MIQQYLKLATAGVLLQDVDVLAVLFLERPNCFLKLTSELVELFNIGTAGTRTVLRRRVQNSSYQIFLARITAQSNQETTPDQSEIEPSRIQRRPTFIQRLKRLSSLGARTNSFRSAPKKVSITCHMD